MDSQPATFKNQGPDGMGGRLCHQISWRGTLSTKLDGNHLKKGGRGCPSRHFQLDFPLPDSPGYGLNYLSGWWQLKDSLKFHPDPRENDPV